jgi:hypothetical protein
MDKHENGRQTLNFGRWKKHLKSKIATHPFFSFVLCCTQLTDFKRGREREREREREKERERETEREREREREREMGGASGSAIQRPRGLASTRKESGRARSR